MELVALPADLLVKVLAWLPAAADLARAAMSCKLCRNALEQAARAHAIGRSLPSLDSRPFLWSFLQLPYFERIRMPWSFWLRVAEVRPRVLAALVPSPAQEACKWLKDNKHDAPTLWCIAYERKIISAAAQEAAALEASRAKEDARAARLAKDKEDRMRWRLEAAARQHRNPHRAASAWHTAPKAKARRRMCEPPSSDSDD